MIVELKDWFVKDGFCIIIVLIFALALCLMTIKKSDCDSNPDTHWDNITGSCVETVCEPEAYMVIEEVNCVGNGCTVNNNYKVEWKVRCKGVLE